MDRNRARWRHFAERGTSYFHGLNKRNRVQTPLKSMTLVHSGGEADVYSGETSKMLHECKTFFEKLYERKPCASPDNFLSDINVQSLLPNQSGELDVALTLDELKESLFSMKSSTSPGPDGYTVPFYKVFWSELGDLVYSALTESYESGFLVEELQRSITVLIPKKSKDTRFVENLRPISLLNVLFKILTKTLARRLTGVIDRMVGGDQTGFVKGRYIGENIRLVLDLMKYSRQHLKPSTSSLGNNSAVRKVMTVQDMLTGPFSSCLF